MDAGIFGRRILLFKGGGVHSQNALFLFLYLAKFSGSDPPLDLPMNGEQTIIIIKTLFIPIVLSLIMYANQEHNLGF